VRLWRPFAPAIVVWLLVAFSFAEAAGPKPRQIIAEFEISPDGDFIRLPVTIGQRDYPFLFSTGMTTTTIDETLRTKLELRKIAVEVGGRRAGQPRDRFGGLRASLGSLPLEFPTGVETGDYVRLREKLDLECEGEIGMDVLRRHIVQIDFDQGILRFLTSLPPSPGEAIRLVPLGGEDGAPTIGVVVSGLPSEKFIVSTGRAGNALEIRSDFLAMLEEKEKVKMLGKEKAVTRSGGLLFQTWRLDSVQVGKFRNERVTVNSAEQNAIGLAYLARFVVTFDFPRSKMYLKKGAHFDDPDTQLELWAVTLARDANTVIVREVAGYGPAQRLGLRAGDAIESINACDVGRMSNWQVRRLLGREGRPLAVVIRRGSEKFTLRNEVRADSREAGDEE
jgi:hypothetical protein